MAARGCSSAVSADTGFVERGTGPAGDDLGGWPWIDSRFTILCEEEDDQTVATAGQPVPQFSPPTPVLGTVFTPDALHGRLLPRELWKPFPTVQDRDGWRAIPEAQRVEWLVLAEAQLGYACPELKATLFMEFRRNGNRSRYEAVHFARRNALMAPVLGECLEAKGRFVDDIVNGVWALCEESF